LDYNTILYKCIFKVVLCQIRVEFKYLIVFAISAPPASLRLPEMLCITKQAGEALRVGVDNFPLFLVDVFYKMW